jgi:hypothetical protein
MKSNHGMHLPVILDLLKTFAFEPRIIRNPYYDEIWTSIRNRVFDHPPKITQCSGASHLVRLLRRLQEKQIEGSAL